MARLAHNKLVRDFIPDIIKGNGDACEVRELSSEEFIVELRKKILEEAGELARAESRDEMLNEYADLMVALDALTAHYEFSEADIKDALARNIEKKGLFEKRIYLTETIDRDA